MSVVDGVFSSGCWFVTSGCCETPGLSVVSPVNMPLKNAAMPAAHSNNAAAIPNRVVRDIAERCSFSLSSLANCGGSAGETGVAGSFGGEDVDAVCAATGVATGAIGSPIAATGRAVGGAVGGILTWSGAGGGSSWSNGARGYEGVAGAAGSAVGGVSDDAVAAVVAVGGSTGFAVGGSDGATGRTAAGCAAAGCAGIGCSDSARSGSAGSASNCGGAHAP